MGNKDQFDLDVQVKQLAQEDIGIDSVGPWTRGCSAYSCVYSLCDGTCYQNTCNAC